MARNRRASAVAAEFIGTFTLVLIVLTMTKSSLNFPFFVSLAAGLAAASAMLVFGGPAGTQLNPAVTLGLLSVRRIAALRALAYITAQLLGGWLAYCVFAYFSGQRWHSVGQFGTKSAVAETLGTFLFSLGWAAIVFRKLEPARSAAVIGLSFAVALLAMSSTGTVTLNPAVALGLRSWIWGSSVLGPAIGAIGGFQAYKYLFAPEGSSAAEQVPLTLADRSAKARLQASKHVR